MPFQLSGPLDLFAVVFGDHASGVFIAVLVHLFPREVTERMTYTGHRLAGCVDNEGPTPSIFEGGCGNGPKDMEILADPGEIRPPLPLGPI